MHLADVVGVGGRRRWLLQVGGLLSQEGIATMRQFFSILPPSPGNGQIRRLISSRRRSECSVSSRWKVRHVAFLRGQVALLKSQRRWGGGR